MMVGILKKTEKGWFVEYSTVSPDPGRNVQIDLLPVYYEESFNLHSLIEGATVNFERTIKPFEVSGINDVQYWAKLVPYKPIVNTFETHFNIMNFNQPAKIIKFQPISYTEQELEEAIRLARKVTINKWGIDEQESLDFVYTDNEIKNRITNKE